MEEIDRYAVSLDNLDVLRAQIAELEAWKAEEMAVMTPLMDYAHSVCTASLGCSLTDWLVSDHKQMVATIAEQAREIDRLMETFVRVADFLNIDTEAARKAPGKPSDVFIAAMKAQPDAVLIKEMIYALGLVAHGSSNNKELRDFCSALIDKARISANAVVMPEQDWRQDYLDLHALYTDLLNNQSRGVPAHSDVLHSVPRELLESIVNTNVADYEVIYQQKKELRALLNGGRS